jgi:hypothetical protein
MGRHTHGDTVFSWPSPIERQGATSPELLGAMSPEPFSWNSPIDREDAMSPDLLIVNASNRVSETCRQALES